MDVDAHAVTEPVPHAAAEAGRRQHLLGSLMGLFARDAGPKHSFHGLVGLPQRVPRRPHLRVGLAEEDRARHVRAVAVGAGTEIEHDALAGLQHGGAGNGVRARAVGPGGHDGGERQALGTMAQHELLELQLHLAFHHARAHIANDVLEGGVGNGLGAAHPRDLVAVLHRAQAHHDAIGLHEGLLRVGFGERLLQAAVLGERDAVLDAQKRIGGPGGPASPPLGGKLRVGLALGAHLQRLEPRGVLAGRHIARVGMQPRVVGADIQSMGRLLVEDIVEGGEPLDVRRVAHEKRPHAQLGKRLAQASQMPLARLWIIQLVEYRHYRPSSTMQKQAVAEVGLPARRLRSDWNSPVGCSTKRAIA